MGTRPRLNVMAMVESIGYADGGAEHLAVRIASELDPDRFNSAICATRWTPEHDGREDVEAAVADLDAAGVDVVRLNRRGRLDVVAWRRFAARLRSQPIHVLHSHMFGSNVWGSILGSVCRVPVIIAHEHMWSFEGAPVRRVFDRDVIARRSDAFLTVSEQSRRMMIEVEGVAASRVQAMTNGIPSRPLGSSDAARKLLGIDPDAFVVGTVGLLRPEKAFEVLIDAAPLIAQQVPSARVVIVGDGPEREMLEARIGERGAGEIVHLAGVRLDVPELLPGFDVAVCCSDWEGGPLSVMEYMQAGLPIVATAVGGIPEMIEDGREALLVPPRDPKALAGAIIELQRDPTRADALRKSALIKQKRDYDLGAMVGKLEALYDRLYDEATQGS
ncbi:glycosyltransferase [soil metagenome]